MELSDLPLEAELAEIADRAEPGRTAQLAVRHWGWDGRGGATLEVTGRELGGITRERVRQLCERLARRLAGVRVGAPALDRAMALAAPDAPTTALVLARRLVSGAVRLSDLHAGIRRHERMREFVMPEYILTELCERLPGVRVTGDVVSAQPPQPAEEVLEATELILLHVLREAGSEADRHELERTCLAEGMKLASFNNRIAYSAIVKGLGHGRYGLRGLTGGEDAHGWPTEAAAASSVLPWPGDPESFRPSRRR